MLVRQDAITQDRESSQPDFTIEAARAASTSETAATLASPGLTAGAARQSKLCHHILYHAHPERLGQGRQHFQPLPLTGGDDFVEDRLTAAAHQLDGATHPCRARIGSTSSAPCSPSPRSRKTEHRTVLGELPVERRGRGDLAGREAKLAQREAKRLADARIVVDDKTIALYLWRSVKERRQDWAQLCSYTTASLHLLSR